MARLPLSIHLRAMLWLTTVSLLDASGSVLPIFVAVAIVLDRLLRSLKPRGHATERAVPPLARPGIPGEFWLFGAMLVLNMMLKTVFVDAASAPHALNIVVTHVLLLVWALSTDPRDERMLRALHRWSRIFIYVLSALLLVQIVWREVLGSYLDFRLLLTGEASRSAVDEHSEGSRPTSLFAEPSNHAVVVFVLTFVHSLTGRRSAWLTIVAACSCLLTNASIGALLALVLLIDAVARHVHPVQWLRKQSPALLLVPVAIVVALATTDPSEAFARAIAQVLAPETGYDPIAVRLYVPLTILGFEVHQHVLGSGLTNYASFPEGLTLNDSSLLLAAYFQMGIIGLIVLYLPLRACLRRHGWRAAFLLAALFLTKLGMLIPAFWGLALLVRHRGIVPRANQAPMRGRPPASRVDANAPTVLGGRGP